MTTLPNDPPTDDDDWSHEQIGRAEEPAADPDDLDAFSDEDLEAIAEEEEAEAAVAPTRVTYPGEDVDDEDEV